MPNTDRKTNRRTATILFEDDQFPDLAITWKVGTNALQLCHKGGAEGGAVVMRTTRIKGGIADPKKAEEEANKWFDSLGVFDEEDDDEEPEWRD